MGKKKVYTIIVPICIVVILSTFCWWGYNRLSLQEEQADIDLFALVPTDCEAIVEIQDVNAMYKNLHGSHCLPPYDLQEVSSLLDLLMGNIESLSKQQAHGLSTEMNRQLLVSFHQPETSRDQIIYGRYANGDLTSINQLIKAKTGKSYSPKKTEYKGEKIIIYPIGNDFIACYLHSGVFAISFQKKLIEKVIETFTSSHEKSILLPDKETKHNEQLALYLPRKDKKRSWRHYEIRMNAEAIYLTGKQMLTEMNLMHENKDILVERTEGEQLPYRVQMMVQTPLHITDSTAEGNTTLSSILKENCFQEVTSIQFAPMGTDTVRHQLLMLPIPTNGEEELKQALHYPLRAKKRTSIWMGGKAYPIWQCNADTALCHYFIQPTTTTDCWISLYQNNLLLADNRETLQEYIAGMQAKEATSPSNLDAFLHCLNDLAEQANYTLVADMSNIVSAPSLATKEYPQIPPLFFKHKDFFKHFMLSTQHINHGGQTHSQTILKHIDK